MQYVLIPYWSLWQWQAQGVIQSDASMVATSGALRAPPAASMALQAQRRWQPFSIDSFPASTGKGHGKGHGKHNGAGKGRGNGAGKGHGNGAGKGRGKGHGKGRGKVRGNGAGKGRGKGHLVFTPPTRRAGTPKLPPTPPPRHLLRERARRRPSQFASLAICSFEHCARPALTECPVCWRLVCRGHLLACSQCPRQFCGNCFFEQGHGCRAMPLDSRLLAATPSLDTADCSPYASTPRSSSSCSKTETLRSSSSCSTTPRVRTMIGSRHMRRLSGFDSDND